MPCSSGIAATVAPLKRSDAILTGLYPNRSTTALPNTPAMANGSAMKSAVIPVIEVLFVVCSVNQMTATCVREFPIWEITFAARSARSGSRLPVAKDALVEFVIRL